MAKPKDAKTQTKEYTVDHDSSGVMTMPSITLLLNRKNFTVTRLTHKDKVGESESPSPIGTIGADDVTQPSIPAPEPTALVTPPNHGPSVKIQTVKPRNTDARSAQRIALWELKQLKNGPDPLGQGLALMIERGAREALFLALQAPPAGSPVPHFVAAAAIAPRERLKLWTGLKWDPTVVPSLWNLFVRSGHAELPPPGAETDIASNRNVVRAAFGVEQDEWLLLVRAGPIDQCRGVIALVSDRSMLAPLVAASPLLGAPVGGTQKKAAS
jgi:hypothetical protein